eukprot:9492139-Pyramimonas_sp.AAC.1
MAVLTKRCNAATCSTHVQSGVLLWLMWWLALTLNTHVWQPPRCNLCGAINVVQSGWCNACGAMHSVQSHVKNCRAMQSRAT